MSNADEKMRIEMRFSDRVPVVVTDTWETIVKLPNGDTFRLSCHRNRLVVTAATPGKMSGMLGVRPRASNVVSISVDEGKE